MRHLLSIADLERGDIERILETAESFAAVAGRDIKKVPTLRGRTVVNLFYEASTRTSSSFEIRDRKQMPHAGTSSAISTSSTPSCSSSRT